MRVRGAGGLLIGVAIYPVSLTLESFARTGQGVEWDHALRSLLWYPEGASPPAHTVAFVILRDVLLIGSLVVGVLGVAGVRASKIPVALAGAGIALGTLPFIIYNPYSFSSSRPPDWVFQDQLWYSSGRWTAVLRFVMAVAVVVLALTDTSSRRPMVPYGPPGIPGSPEMPGMPPIQPQPSHWAGQPAPTPGGPPAAGPTPPTPAGPPATAPAPTGPATTGPTPTAPSPPPGSQSEGPSSPVSPPG